jgi:uncharacterized protein YgiM (DUF1202 family)
MRFFAPRPSLRLRYFAGVLLAVIGLFAVALSPLSAQSIPQAVRNAARSAARVSQTGVVITEDTRLNMRSGPGADFDIVTKLDPDDFVQVLGASDDGAWMQVREIDGDASGWVAAEFIRLTSVEQEADEPPAERTDDSFVLLPTPTPTPLVRSSAVATVTLPATPAATPTDIAPAALDGPALPPLLLPTPTATVMGAAPAAAQAADAPAQVPEEESVAARPSPTPQATPTVPMAITQPERMNLRAGPGTVYAVAGSAPAGSAFEVLAFAPGRDWLQVRVSEAEEPAWLFGSLVSLTGPTDGLAVLTEDELPPAPTPAPAAEQPAVQAAAAADPVAPPPSGAGFFGYGVQAHLLGGGAGAALNAVNDLGFNWIKQQVEWRLFQPQPGAIGFGELGGIVSEANNRGINVLFSVVNAPEWAREPGFDGSVGGPPADPQSYAAFVGAMAGQFCGTSLKAIEIWNEQNLHYEWGNKPLDPAEYMNLLKPAYASIKAACPEMLVISGALTPAGSNPPFAVDDFAYLEGMYQNGLAAYSDGIGAHPSGYNVPPSVRWEEACSVIQQTGNTFNGACDTPHHSWSFRSTMEGYRNIMVVYGDANKRIWPTEFGWAAGGAFDPRYAYANDNGFDEQAAWTVEAYTMMRDWGWVGPAFLWNLNFRVVADGTEKAQWGIVGNDYQPLPVYHALKAMPK